MAMAPHRRGRSPPSSPPRLTDHLIEDIFFRLPPEDPSCLLRASLVCKHWRYLIFHPRFVRYLHAHRRAPQMLGFLQNSEKGCLPTYFPTSPFPFPFPDRGAWHVLDYRHGRALFGSNSTKGLLLVWEPFTGARWEVRVPADFTIQYDNASVLCAADGCNHLNCYGGPFRVVLVFCAPFDKETESITSACVYSSETGAWGELALRDGYSLICSSPGLLVGNSLLYFLSGDGYILEYDLACHVLDVIIPPDRDAALMQRVVLVQAEDGGLGIVQVDDEWKNTLYRWSWEASEEGDAQWVERPDIYLDDALPATVTLMFFVEGANTFLASTDAGFFSVDLHSKRATKVCKNRCSRYPLVPIVSSYTLGPTLEERHGLRSPDSGDEEYDEEYWEEVRQVEFLFSKGSMALEKGDFVGAVDSLSQVLKRRVALYGELAPACASTYYRYGCALLYKAQKSTELLGNVPEKGTISNADTKEGHNSNGKDQDDRDSDNDKAMSGDGDDSDVDLARKMLDVARVIIEGSTDNTVDSPEISKILSALTEVSMEKRKRGIR
ncbi:unnamed protein product [Alopecurus aequalis]